MISLFASSDMREYFLDFDFAKIFITLYNLTLSSEDFGPIVLVDRLVPSI